jgi:serine/threonine protein kinase
MLPPLPAKFTDIHPLLPGKNATVYGATNALVNRDVFLKLYPVIAGDVGSALREPHLLTALEHENLAHIFGADTVPNDFILLEMELITGGSFQQIIDQSTENGVWPSVHKCIQLIRDAAAGLSHLNTKGFVHRDVKPTNLVVRINGERQVGVVTDLGLVSKLNQQGRAFSSRHARIYRPPEVWAGAGYSVKSDVYQLGIVLFQLLGGFLDYGLGNLDDTDLAARVSAGTLIDLSTIGGDVDVVLRKVVKTAIARESERYVSMTDFLVALNHAKVNQLDWRYTVTDEGFMLMRQSGNDQYRVAVAVEGKRHLVRRSKAGKSGIFRAKNPPMEIIHVDIGSCRKFRELLRW